MATDSENARVTELHVPMDCSGCVRRIKKAIHSIDGVHNVHVDISQQKLTVVGRADPDALVKAIKKTRKIAIVSSHCEPPGEAAPPAEAEPTNDPPPPENPAPEESKLSPEPQEPTPVKSRNVEEVRHVVHGYPHEHVIREHWNNYPPITHEAPCVTHSFNTHSPSPSETGSGYLWPPPRDMTYNSMETNNDGYYQNRGSEEYYQSRRDDGNHYNSMFSDENPNACNIV